MRSIINLINFLENLGQRFLHPKNRTYKYYSLDKNKFISPTQRQLKRLINVVNYENEYFRKVDKICQKINVHKIIDIGSNIGYWSYAFSKSDDLNREVIAFEPDIRNLFYAAHNLHKCKNISLFHLGLSDEYGRFKVSMPKDILKRKKEGRYNTGLLTALDNQSLQGSHFLIGDKFLESININPLDIACIKIDVEGFEYKVINGLQRTLALTNAIMIIEINPITIKKAGITFNYLINNLMSYGFKSLMDPTLQIKFKDGAPNGSFNLLACKDNIYKECKRIMNYIDVPL